MCIRDSQNAHRCIAKETLQAQPDRVGGVPRRWRQAVLVLGGVSAVRVGGVPCRARELGHLQHACPGSGSLQHASACHFPCPRRSACQCVSWHSCSTAT
eukprot:4739853-Alexandrium_andersonii.AAC.1